MIKGKVVLVTGVTRGIGKAIFYSFAKANAIVYGVYASNKGKADEIAEDMKQKGYNANLVQGDITDKVFVENLVRDIVAKHGVIDVLVNNAGIARDNIIIKMTESDWSKVLDVNFGGTYNCIMAVMPYMKKQKSGNVVNIVSVTGVRGREAQSNYGASKGAIMGLSKTLSRKYGKYNIRFNCVAPGMIATEMVDEVPKNKLDNFLKFTTLDRLGKPEEVAKTVLYLSDEESSYLANSVIQLDGGFIK